jgi:hypothetical protein
MSRISPLELELEEGRSFEDGRGDFEDALDGELDDSETHDAELVFEGDDAELDDAELDDAELDDAELDDAELELESDADGEVNDELDGELAEPDRFRFAERLYELSLNGADSELELSHEVDAIVREMEHEYFLKRLKNIGRRLKKVGGAALKGAVKAASGALPIKNLTQLATSLASGDMRGFLGSLASTAMSVASKHPALAAAMPALKALGFDGGGTQPWKNFTTMAKDAYGQLAKSVENEVLKPATAQRTARRAFHGALVRARSRRTRSGGGGNTGKRKRVVTLSRGDVLVVRVR